MNIRMTNSFYVAINFMVILSLCVIFISVFTSILFQKNFYWLLIFLAFDILAIPIYDYLDTENVNKIEEDNHLLKKCTYQLYDDDLYIKKYILFVPVWVEAEKTYKIKTLQDLIDYKIQYQQEYKEKKENNSETVTI